MKFVSIIDEGTASSDLLDVLSVSEGELPVILELLNEFLELFNLLVTNVLLLYKIFEY